jgi:hypothetical protein
MKFVGWKIVPWIVDLGAMEAIVRELRQGEDQI